MTAFPLTEKGVEAVGAGVGSAAFDAPKLNDPMAGAAGAAAGFSVVVSAAFPNENGEEADADSLGASPTFCRDEPNWNGGGEAAMAGVVVPEPGWDFCPKKLGTLELVSVDPDADAGVEGLPRPNENCFFAGSASTGLVVELLGGAKNDEVGAEVEGADRDAVGDGFRPAEREKKPFSSGLSADTVGVSVREAAFVLLASSGESGSATIDPAARGDDARGRVELRRDRGPPTDRPEFDGTLNELALLEVAGPKRPSRDDPESEAGATAGVSCLGVGADRPNEIPVKDDGKEILVCSSSSISGRSSSLAE